MCLLDSTRCRPGLLTLSIVKYFKYYPSDFKYCYYWQYVDDIFVLFISPENLEAFQNVLNDQHANMLLTNKNEK